MVNPVMLDAASVPNAVLIYPESFPNGGSNPRVCDFDDLVLRLVKWHPSRHGKTATYSELIASRIGQLFEAPVMRGNIVYVDTQLSAGHVDNVSQPFHVGFTFSAGENFTESHYGRIDNTAALAAAAVQLAWLQIDDQVGHNQYFSQLQEVLPDRTTRQLNRFFLIDQAFICGSRDWTVAALDQPGSPYRLPPHLAGRLTVAAIQPIIDQVLALEEEEIISCFRFYPDSWGITGEQVDRAVQYILERRQYIAEIIFNNLVS